jgi:pyruvate, water dikinase
MVATNEFVKHVSDTFVIPISSVPTGAKGVALTGGKVASLKKLELIPGVKTAPGYAITTDAYKYILHPIKEEVESILEEAKSRQATGNALSVLMEQIRNLIIAEFEKPRCDELKKQIVEAYLQLSKQFGTKNARVAMRSSATAEDLPTASFAGMQKTILNVESIQNVINAYIDSLASIFTNRAYDYRQNQKISHIHTLMSVGMQIMVPSQVAGVVFTNNINTSSTKEGVINFSYGLGEAVVSGIVKSDGIIFSKALAESGKNALVEKKLGSKLVKVVYAEDNDILPEGEFTKTVETTQQERQKFALSDNDLNKLINISLNIEEYYKKSEGHEAVDIEWGYANGEFYILQCRPRTVSGDNFLSYTIDEEFIKDNNLQPIAEGAAIGDGVAVSEVCIVSNHTDAENFRHNSILVSEITDPDLEEQMAKSGGGITDQGDETSHAAIIFSELGKQAVVGTGNITSIVKNGDIVTIDNTSGKGLVYLGNVPFEKEIIQIPKGKTKVKIGLNASFPSVAVKAAGIEDISILGLARMEFAIAANKVHPLCFTSTQYSNLPSDIKYEVDKLTYGYESPEEFYIQNLARYMIRTAAAVYPRKVRMRTVDFKTVEYYNLTGGYLFEPIERNPFMGERGLDRAEGFYQPAWEMDIEAYRRAMEVMDNITPMFAFVRSIDNLQKEIQKFQNFGVKGKFALMVELPENIFMIEEYAQMPEIDGFSIGSNDLRSGLLMADRDNRNMGKYKITHPAVKKAVSIAIHGAKKFNKSIGICGQAPATNVEFLNFLISEGIDYISVPFSAIPKVKANILAAEAK